MTSPWSQCSMTCDIGYRSRQRKCLNGFIGDLGCTGATNKTELCSNVRCPTWSEWTECSKLCGNGIRSRFKNDEGNEIEICNNSPCTQRTNICEEGGTLMKEEIIRLNNTAELNIICISETNSTRGYMSINVKQNISRFRNETETFTSFTWDKVWLAYENNSRYVINLSGNQ